MPDGTPFSIPEDTDPPAPLELTGSERGATVFLAMPLRQQGAFETGGDRREDAGTRFRRASCTTRRTPIAAVSPMRRWRSGAPA